MLALLKMTFLQPVGDSDISFFDRILSMDDGFEFLLKNRYQPAPAEELSHPAEKKFPNMEGLSKLYDLCSGRVFSATHETDPDFVKILAEVGLHCEVLILAF